jgi:hypothetical protein
MLLGVIAPGTQVFSFEPATDRAGRDGRQAGILGNVARQFGSTPARERHLALSGQATSDGRDLRAHLRGGNASAPHCEARQPVNAS